MYGGLELRLVLSLSSTTSTTDDSLPRVWTSPQATVCIALGPVPQGLLRGSISVSGPSAERLSAEEPARRNVTTLEGQCFSIATVTRGFV